MQILLRCSEIITTQVFFNLFLEAEPFAGGASTALDALRAQKTCLVATNVV